MDTTEWKFRHQVFSDREGRNTLSAPGRGRSIERREAARKIPHARHKIWIERETTDTRPAMTFFSIIPFLTLMLDA